MHKNEPFCGPLAELLKEYILLKRATGCKYIAEARLWHRFDSLTLKFDNPKNTLPKDLVSVWVQRQPNEKALTQSKRTTAIKRFAEFMTERGYDAYIWPYASPQLDDQYTPYIFSESEMNRILSLADRYPAPNASTNLHLTIPVAMRLLYGCGLRASELVSLRIQDVDIENGVLTVRESKFQKSRIVPMADTLTKRCAEYILATGNVQNKDGFFLCNPKGRKYQSQAVYYWFRCLIYKAGIPHGGKGVGPRLHDIRHTFAVHSLKRHVLEGKDISSMLPFLSAYMGHCDLRGTQIYLRLMPDMFPHIASTMEVFFSGGDAHESD